MENYIEFSNTKATIYWVLLYALGTSIYAKYFTEIVLFNPYTVDIAIGFGPILQMRKLKVKKIKHFPSK